MISSVREQLCQALTERIAGLAHGDRLPPERALAQEYGVSRDTVRRVLREFAAQGMISPMPGVGHVRLDMGPKPDRHLGRGIVGLILAHRGINSLDARLLIGFEDGIRATGSNFSVHASHSVDEELRMIDDFIERGAPGIAIAYWGGNGQQNNVARLVESGTPFIALERFLVGHPSSYVVSDEEKVMSSAVEFLADRGHRRVVYVSNARDYRFSSAVERRSAFQDSLRARGATEAELAESVVNVRVDRLAGAVAALCARKPRVGAYCCDSWFAARFTDCLRRNGRRVPDDVDVVAVSGMPYEVSVPAVIADTYEIGYRGALRLAELMGVPGRSIEERVAPITALGSGDEGYYGRIASGRAPRGVSGRSRARR